MKDLKEYLLFKDVSLDIDSPVKFDFDHLQSNFFFELKDGSEKYLTTYGAGHQSLANMMLMNVV